jgi:hypothetical protein
VAAGGSHRAGSSGPCNKRRAAVSPERRAVQAAGPASGGPVGADDALETAVADDVDADDGDAEGFRLVKRRSPLSTRRPFYAVAHGVHGSAIYHSGPDKDYGPIKACSDRVPGCFHKGCKTLEEARQWILTHHRTGCVPATMTDILTPRDAPSLSAPADTGPPPASHEGAS